MARIFLREVECQNEKVCQEVKCKGFEWSHELDTALYKNIPLLLIVVFFTYFGASFETNATFRSVAYRSWSHIGSCL